MLENRSLQKSLKRFLRHRNLQKLRFCGLKITDFEDLWFF